MRLIDADALYERACELEAQALEYVGKIIHDDERIEEWRRWSAILNERTAFKHDVYDAPTIEPERTGKWIGYNTEQDGWKRTDGSPVFMSCSECNGLVLNNGSAHWNYCPNCGARMEP